MTHFGILLVLLSNTDYRFCYAKENASKLNCLQTNQIFTNNWLLKVPQVSTNSCTSKNYVNQLEKFS